MNLGHVYPGADQPHPHAFRTYCGRAFLQTHNFNSPDDLPGPDNAMHSIMLAVPASVHREVLDHRPPIHATASLVPWTAGAGLGLLVVRVKTDVVLALVDIAGRRDLAELHVAARDGKVNVGLASDADPDVTPLIPLAGLADALSDARSLRRLGARELAAAASELRELLRGPAARGLLGVPLARFDSLTFNICPL